MTGKNIMSYICVLELSRYGHLKLAANFFKCIFLSSESSDRENQKRKNPIQHYFSFQKKN